MISIYFEHASEFELPLRPGDEDKIDNLIEFSIIFKNLIRLMCITAVLMILRVILLLKNQFPQFSVIFDTITKAKGDFASYLIMTLVVFLGFVLCGILAFGPYYAPLHNFDRSFFHIYIVLFGNIEKDTLVEAN